MKPWKKIVLGVSLGLTAAVIGLGVWQKDNLKALYTFLANDSEQLSQTLQDKQQAQQETLQNDYNITVLAPDLNISNDLLDGKISPDEAKENLGIVQPAPEPETVPTPAPLPEETPTPAPEETPAPEVPEEPVPPELTEEQRKQKLDELVNQCVAELYACEVDLMAKLGKMKQAAVDQ